MNRFMLIVWMSVVTAALSPSVVAAGIQVENDGRSTLHVFVMGVKDSQWRGPFTVQPGKALPLDVPPGRYYVIAQKPDKSYSSLGWQDYTDNKIVYRLSLCAACRYVKTGEAAVGSTEVLQPAVYHAGGTYKCSTCGQFHTRWEPGWKAGDVESGRVNKTGHVSMDEYVEYRLGVAVTDGANGATVTDAFENAPSRKLRSAEGDQTKRHYLVPGKAVITSVNGKATANVAEFLKALRESPHRVELEVSSIRGQINERYWTDLSE